MHILALADIHGNLPALQAVLAASRTPLDMIIVAGDLVGFGPQPAHVVDLLRGRGCSFVKGNVDDYVSSPSSIERLHKFARHELNSGRPFRPLLPLAAISESVEWTRHQIGDRAGFLAELPFSISVEPSPGRELKVVHANPRDLERPILKKAADSDLPLLDGIDCEVLVFGHSHSPFRRLVGGTMLLDVASLGFPTDGCCDAPYADITFDDGTWHLEQHRVPYDTEATGSLIEASTMPNKDMVLTLLRTARPVKDR